jgi:hypothetical protein
MSICVLYRRDPYSFVFGGEGSRTPVSYRYIEQHPGKVLSEQYRLGS